MSSSRHGYNISACNDTDKYPSTRALDQAIMRDLDLKLLQYKHTLQNEEMQQRSLKKRMKAKDEIIQFLESRNKENHLAEGPRSSTGIHNKSIQDPKAKRLDHLLAVRRAMENVLHAEVLCLNGVIESQRRLLEKWTPIVDKQAAASVAVATPKSSKKELRINDDVDVITGSGRKESVKEYKEYDWVSDLRRLEPSAPSSSLSRRGESASNGATGRRSSTSTSVNADTTSASRSRSRSRSRSTSPIRSSSLKKGRHDSSSKELLRSWESVQSVQPVSSARSRHSAGATATTSTSAGSSSSATHQQATTPAPGTGPYISHFDLANSNPHTHTHAAASFITTDPADDNNAPSVPRQSLDFTTSASTSTPKPFTPTPVKTTTTGTMKNYPSTSSRIPAQLPHHGDYHAGHGDHRPLHAQEVVGIREGLPDEAHLSYLPPPPYSSQGACSSRSGRKNKSSEGPTATTTVNADTIHVTGTASRNSRQSVVLSTTSEETRTAVAATRTVSPGPSRPPPPPPSTISSRGRATATITATPSRKTPTSHTPPRSAATRTPPRSRSPACPSGADTDMTTMSSRIKQLYRQSSSSSKQKGRVVIGTDPPVQQQGCSEDNFPLWIDNNNTDYNYYHTYDHNNVHGNGHGRHQAAGIISPGSSSTRKPSSSLPSSSSALEGDHNRPRSSSSRNKSINGDDHGHSDGGANASSTAAAAHNAARINADADANNVATLTRGNDQSLRQLPQQYQYQYQNNKRKIKSVEVQIDEASLLRSAAPTTTVVGEEEGTVISTTSASAVASLSSGRKSSKTRGHDTQRENNNTRDQIAHAGSSSEENKEGQVKKYSRHVHNQDTGSTTTLTIPSSSGRGTRESPDDDNYYATTTTTSNGNDSSPRDIMEHPTVKDAMLKSATKSQSRSNIKSLLAASEVMAAAASRRRLHVHSHSHRGGTERQQLISSTAIGTSTEEEKGGTTPLPLKKAGRSEPSSLVAADDEEDEEDDSSYGDDGQILSSSPHHPHNHDNDNGNGVLGLSVSASSVQREIISAWLHRAEDGSPPPRPTENHAGTAAAGGGGGDVRVNHHRHSVTTADLRPPTKSITTATETARSIRVAPSDTTPAMKSDGGRGSPAPSDLITAKKKGKAMTGVHTSSSKDRGQQQREQEEEELRWATSLSQHNSSTLGGAVRPSSQQQQKQQQPLLMTPVPSPSPQEWATAVNSLMYHQHITAINVTNKNNSSRNKKQEDALPLPLPTPQSQPLSALTTRTRSPSTVTTTTNKKKKKTIKRLKILSTASAAIAPIGGETTQEPRQHTTRVRRSRHSIDTNNLVIVPSTSAIPIVDTEYWTKPVIVPTAKQKKASPPHRPGVVSKHKSAIESRMFREESSVDVSSSVQTPAATATAATAAAGAKDPLPFGIHPRHFKAVPFKKVIKIKRAVPLQFFRAATHGTAAGTAAGTTATAGAAAQRGRLNNNTGHRDREDRDILDLQKKHHIGTSSMPQKAGRSTATAASTASIPPMKVAALGNNSGAAVTNIYHSHDHFAAPYAISTHRHPPHQKKTTSATTTNSSSNSSKNHQDPVVVPYLTSSYAAASDAARPLPSSRHRHRPYTTGSLASSSSQATSPSSPLNSRLDTERPPPPPVEESGPGPGFAMISPRRKLPATLRTANISSADIYRRHTIKHHELFDITGAPSGWRFSRKEGHRPRKLI